MRVPATRVHFSNQSVGKMRRRRAKFRAFSRNFSQNNQNTPSVARHWHTLFFVCNNSQQCRSIPAAPLSAPASTPAAALVLLPVLLVASRPLWGQLFAIQDQRLRCRGFLVPAATELYRHPRLLSETIPPTIPRRRVAALSRPGHCMLCHTGR